MFRRGTDKERSQGGGWPFRRFQGRAKAVFGVVLARKVDSQRSGACCIVSTDRGLANDALATGKAGRGRAVVGTATFAQLNYVFLHQQLEIVAPACPMDGVDSLRVVDVLNQFPELGWCIHR